VKISVVIPLFNKRYTILRAIQSVMNQTVLPHEIVIVNDGSSDGSEKLVDGLLNPLVRLLHQSNNGVSAARNKGVANAKGNWIALLDADDEWNKDQLHQYDELIKNNPEAKMVATSYFLGNVNGEKVPIVLNRINLSGTGLLKNYFEVATHSSPPVFSSAVCLHKNSLLSIGGFPEGIASGEDLLTWARMAAKFPIAYSLNHGATFWQDEAHTYGRKPNRVPDPNDAVGRALRLLLTNTNEPSRMQLKKYVAHWYKMRASIYLRLGNRSASKEIFKSLRLNPSNRKVYFYLVVLLLPVTYRNSFFKRLSKS
jgi:glycosyltransferase involved in cell wall biosynthesis